MNMPTLFANELKAFEDRKAELLRIAEGKFALFKGNNFEGVFDTPLAAYEAGLAKWGNVPFFVKQVLMEESVQQVPALYSGLLNAHL
jgi:hypothetical protein